MSQKKISLNKSRAITRVELHSMSSRTCPEMLGFS